MDQLSEGLEGLLVLRVLKRQIKQPVVDAFELFIFKPVCLLQPCDQFAAELVWVAMPEADLVVQGLQQFAALALFLLIVEGLLQHLVYLLPVECHLLIRRQFG